MNLRLWRRITVRLFISLLYFSLNTVCEPTGFYISRLWLRPHPVRGLLSKVFTFRNALASEYYSFFASLSFRLGIFRNAPLWRSAPPHPRFHTIAPFYLHSINSSPTFRVRKSLGEHSRQHPRIFFASQIMISGKRKAVLLVVMASTLVAAQPDVCQIPGDADILGLGVRLGLYF
jgi:hypothetical protein